MPTVLSPEIREELLAPLEIWEVMLDNSTIKFYQPLVLTPELLPDGDEYLSVEYPKLGISAFGRNREELWDCIQSCIRVHWKEYVREQDCRLAPLAQSFKNAFLDMAEEVNDE